MKKTRPVKCDKGNQEELFLYLYSEIKKCETSRNTSNSILHYFVNEYKMFNYKIILSAQ